MTPVRPFVPTRSMPREVRNAALFCALSGTKRMSSGCRTTSAISPEKIFFRFRGTSARRVARAMRKIFLSVGMRCARGLCQRNRLENGQRVTSHSAQTTGSFHGAEHINRFPRVEPKMMSFGGS